MEHLAAGVVVVLVAALELGPSARASQQTQWACLCTPTPMISEFEPTCPLDLQDLIAGHGQCKRVGWNCTDKIKECSVAVTAGAGNATATAPCGTLGSDYIFCEEGGFYAIAVDCASCPN